MRFTFYAALVATVSAVSVEVTQDDYAEAFEELFYAQEFTDEEFVGIAATLVKAAVKTLMDPGVRSCIGDAVKGITSAIMSGKMDYDDINFAEYEDPETMEFLVQIELADQLGLTAEWGWNPIAAVKSAASAVGHAASSVGHAIGSGLNKLKELASKALNVFGPKVVAFFKNKRVQQCLLHAGWTFASNALPFPLPKIFEMMDDEEFSQRIEEAMYQLSDEDMKEIFAEMSDEAIY